MLFRSARGVLHVETPLPREERTGEDRELSDVASPFVCLEDRGGMAEINF